MGNCYKNGSLLYVSRYNNPLLWRAYTYRLKDKVGMNCIYFFVFIQVTGPGRKVIYEKGHFWNNCFWIILMKYILCYGGHVGKLHSDRMTNFLKPCIERILPKNTAGLFLCGLNVSVMKWTKVKFYSIMAKWTEQRTLQLRYYVVVHTPSTIILLTLRTCFT